MFRTHVPTSFGNIAITQNRNTGFPIVLIHGNSLSANTFKYQLESHTLKGFRIVAPDLPGHGMTGKNTKPEEAYSPQSYTKLIVEICIRMNIAEGIIAGHSLGGHMIISALEYLPSIKGALVFGTPPLTVPARLDKAFIRGLALSLAFKPNLSEEEVKTLASGFVLAGSVPPREITESILETDPLVRLVIGQALTGGTTVDEAQKIRNFRKPFAILLGSGDQMVNPGYINDLALKCLWNDKVTFIDSAGHSPHIEQPEEFNSLLLSFLNGLK